MNKPNLAPRLNAAIDHTVLGTDVTRDRVQLLCSEANQAGFHAVCVNPTWVSEARALVADGIAVAEAAIAIESGAGELDVVMNVGRFLSGDESIVSEEVGLICELGQPVKVILECAVLDDDQKRAAALLCVDAGAAFVKTSTGFGPGGATLDDVALLRSVVGPSIGVKASGGIRDTETAIAMLDAGADRLGTSASMAIIGGSVDGD